MKLNLIIYRCIPQVMNRRGMMIRFVSGWLMEKYGGQLASKVAIKGLCGVVEKMTTFVWYWLLGGAMECVPPSKSHLILWLVG